MSVLQRLMFQNKVDEVRTQTKKFFEDKTESVKHKWEETSRDVISSFLRVFGGSGNDWNVYPRIMRALRSPSPSPTHSDQEEEEDVPSDKQLAAKRKSDNGVQIALAAPKRAK